MKNSVNLTIVIVGILAALILAGLWFTAQSDVLVVYCSQDEVYAQQILNDFTRQTGIPVRARFDTEATKSLGLVNLITQERERPRCDVFWNNELLGMVELREQGLLEYYRGTGWKRMPERFRDPEGAWVGFAARLRVYILNTKSPAPAPADATLEGMVGLDPSRMAMAKPLFGTTLTQYTILWKLWGPERLKAWHADWRSRGLREVNGNAAVKDVVAMGTCAIGMTDNDDYFVAADDKQPVEMRPIWLSPVVDNAQSNEQSGQVPDTASEKSNGPREKFTVCIPNSVGIIRGTQHFPEARKLVDFLTSAQTEMALAKAKSRQIPLGPVDEAQLPDDVRALATWARDGFDLRPLLPARRECLKWLQGEYLK